MSHLNRSFATSGLLICGVGALAQGPKSILPGATSVKGWQQVGATKMFDPNNLFDLIDGEAESIKQYAFTACAHAEYGPAGQKTPSLTIDIFDMTDPLNSFGLFSSDRLSGKPVKIGVEGVQIGKTGVNFWKGRYVVRTTIVKDSPAAQTAIMEYAKFVESKISGSGDAPALIKALPDDRQARSEKYVRANVAGQAFLKNAVTARYPSAGSSAELFIAEYPNPAGAKAALASYKSYEKAGTGLAPAPGIGDEAFSVVDKFAKNVVVAVKGKYCVGVVRAKDMPGALALVKSAVGKLK